MRNLLPCLRRAGRLLKAIIRRGSIQPVILLLIFNLLFSGATLFFAKPTATINYPVTFAVAYLALATIGSIGLLSRDHWLKASFGFLGLFLRIWMATRFFIDNPYNPEWCSFAVGAIGYGWIAARSSCCRAFVNTGFPHLNP